MVCGTGGKGNCRATNVTYKIECSECRDYYIGESSRNGYTRGREHLTSLENKTADSVLYRHIRDKHSDHNCVRPTFKMTILATHQSALNRQVSEAVMINKAPSTNRLMNRKTEWGHTKIVSCTLTQE